MMQETRQKLDTTLSSVEMQSAHVVHVPMSDKHGGLKRCNPRDTTLYSNMSLTLVTTWERSPRTMSNATFNPSAGNTMQVSTPEIDLCKPILITARSA
jgi:hypothetical protein